LVEKVEAYVRRRLTEAPDGRITLAELGDVVSLSPSHLQRTFTRATGVSPAEYVSARRMESFKRSLGGGNSVASATYDAGFGSSSRVYERSNATLGMTPGAYRRGGARVTIRYATVASPLGRLLVAATERGLCAVSVGAADAALLAALKREYPAATLEADVGLLGGLVKRVLRVLDGREPGSDLPTDLRATAFQRRVWRELQKIPFGETRSYGEIAKKIGRKSAARAVAQACASNRLALVVPCHRVVRDDGDAGGYRWGAARKKKILAHEAETVSDARGPVLPKARKRSR
jgi:AraC family transcriptional regulator of adaptative response/methylated-DNA-[protein]-cysteine methyltransferase